MGSRTGDVDNFGRRLREGMFLLTSVPKWHRIILELRRNAHGGQCPLVGRMT